MLLPLPFDAHNHVHMGPSSPISTLDVLGESECALQKYQQHQVLSGMALMSTHPRDYSRVLDLCTSQRHNYLPDTALVPCFGVHPWFVHELTDADWALYMHPEEELLQLPRWILDLEQVLLDADSKLLSSSSSSMSSTTTVKLQKSIVGEIGLDKFHYDFKTGELQSSWEKQLQAFQYQLELATRLERPVSLHCVHAMGPLMDCIKNVKQSHQGRLPPALYFHAFGGKAASVDQLIALCCNKRSKKQQSKADAATGSKVYFGFAPVVNLRSPKTNEVVQKVGLDRLVLETDEPLVPQSMQLGVEFLADALGVDPAELIRQTNANAMDLYGIMADRDE
jgi:Tat protein secretion system quality control protein TatD with DNase activity